MNKHAASQFIATLDLAWRLIGDLPVEEQKKIEDLTDFFDDHGFLSEVQFGELKEIIRGMH